MILISNHLLTLPQFENVDDVVIRINMAHVKDSKQLEESELTDKDKLNLLNLLILPFFHLHS